MPQFAAFIPGLIAAGGSILGSIMGSNASSSAAQDEMLGQTAGYNTDAGMYSQAMGNLNPFIGTGMGALNNLDSLLGITPQQPASNPNFSSILNTLNTGIQANKPRSMMDTMADPFNLFANHGGPRAAVDPIGAQWHKMTGMWDPGNTVGNILGLAYGGRASGGNSGRDIIVGEDGPELLHMNPGSTGHVTPNPGTMSRVMQHRMYGGPVGVAMPIGNPFFPSPTNNTGFNPLGGNNTTMSNGQTPASIMQMQPQYQFTLQQGINALQNSGLASGNFLSGQGTSGVLNYAEGLANNTFQNIVNNQANAASLGASASGMGGQLASFMGMNMAQLMAAFGNAGASGIVGSNNATTGGINQLAQIMGMFGGGGGGGGFFGGF